MSYIGINPSAVYDSLGNPISSVNVPGQGNALSVEQSATGFVFSTNNSSTTQLASNATFTGTIETALNQSAISLLMTSDQPMTLTVKQYIDIAGTFAAPPIVFNILAGAQFSRSIALNANYVQVTVKNVGTATTTTFNLNTAYGTIESVDSNGAVPVVGYQTGQTGGDFDGIATIDNVIRGDLALHTKVINQPTQDINGSTIISDAPQVIKATLGVVGQSIIIDTIGYNSLSTTPTSPFIGTITSSNDGANWATLQGVNGNGAAVSNIASGSSQIFPSQGRYVKITCSTIGTFTYSLRKVNSSSATNIIAFGGSIINTATAQLGVNVMSTSSSNGMTLGTLVAPLTVAATVVKATAGKLYALNVGNPQVTAVYLKLYNAASVTLGTTSPIQNIMIPASSTVSIPINDTGLFFSTGICFAVTGGQALLDSTALTTASVVNYSFI